MAERFSTLGDWLAWQETLHPAEIELGLERVGRVYRRLGGLRPAPVVITVAGTNGKGSSVTFLEAVLRAAGYRTGAYTSPHLLRYNERIRIDGDEQPDEVICDAFARVDDARGDESLTYFESGTLAALDIFAHGGLDVAILEVGLGGRLDAVNIIDPDVALVTRIGIDHTDWLGPDRESIGREKAGIFRAGRPAVCADPAPPRSLAAEAQRVGAPWYALGEQFEHGLAPDASTWHWHGVQTRYDDLPLPTLAGAHQLLNASGVLMVLECLRERLPVPAQAVVQGLQQARLAGRFQRIPGPVEQVLDVAHNAQGAQVLATALAQQPCRGRTLALLGMMADKDCSAFIGPLSGQVDAWYPVGLQYERAAQPQQLTQCLRQSLPGVSCQPCPDVASARQTILQQAAEGDRILVCGSFHTVAEWLAAAEPGQRQ